RNANVSQSNLSAREVIQIESLEFCARVGREPPPELNGVARSKTGEQMAAPAISRQVASGDYATWIGGGGWTGNGRLRVRIPAGIDRRRSGAAEGRVVERDICNHATIGDRVVTGRGHIGPRTTIARILDSDAVPALL